MLDPQDETYDRRLAKHLVSLYHQTPEQEEEELMVSVRGEGVGREHDPTQECPLIPLIFNVMVFTMLLPMTLED